MAGWLTPILGRSCRLIQQNPHLHRNSRRSSRPNNNEEGPPQLSLANEAQYLLLSMSSLERLLADVRRQQPEWQGVDVDGLATRFRANFVVRGEVGVYAEERWKEVRIGRQKFQVGEFCTRLGTSHFVL